MDVILAQKFAPFDFSAILGFPNVVPIMDEWGDCLPRFRENKDDHPAKHLLDFHEIMNQLGIYHEYVLMKMFMYSLVGDARQWYQSLPASSIFSFREFHVAFHKHCKIIFSAKLLFEDFCEHGQFKKSARNSDQNVFL